jgi:hypothetical protein
MARGRGTYPGVDDPALNPNHQRTHRGCGAVGPHSARLEPRGSAARGRLRISGMSNAHFSVRFPPKCTPAAARDVRSHGAQLAGVAQTATTASNVSQHHQSHTFPSTNFLAARSAEWCRGQGRRAGVGRARVGPRGSSEPWVRGVGSHGACLGRGAAKWYPQSEVGAGRRLSPRPQAPIIRRLWREEPGWSSWR